MPSQSPRDPRGDAALLAVGPGARARDLGVVLGALGAAHGVKIRAFEDVGHLAESAERVALLVLDVDAVPIEDVGYVRRFLAAQPDVDVVLLGDDPRARTARVLGARRFVHWPPDVEQLAEFVDGARGVERDVASGMRRIASTRERARTNPTRTSPTRADPADVAADEFDELEEVRAILAASAVAESTPAARAPRAASSVDATAQDCAPFQDLPDPGADESPPGAAELDLGEFAGDFERVSKAGRSAFAEASTESTARPPIDAPPWWRAQVADLADTAQRIDLSVKMLAQSAPEIDEGDLDDARARLRELEAEVARLLQFTRTLGYVAAPPPAGSQVFDLGEMVHHFATDLAQSGPEAPRCQFKTTPAATVRSDRQLLSQALDAIFFLVRCTARKGDLVRARVQPIQDDAGAWIELDLDFPSGPIEGFSEDDVVSPYGLADLFPELGPNALAAATGIAAGQGGRLGLESRARARMTWRLRLPHAAT